MKRHIISVIVIAVSMAGAACQSPPPAPAAAAFAETDRNAVREAGSSWAVHANAKDWAAVGALYTDDAVVLPPNAEAVQGRSAIQSMFSSFPNTSFQTEAIEIEGAGDLAYVRGRYSLTSTPDGGPSTTDKGKYLEIWRKQADGSWKLTRDMFSSDVPPAAPAPTK